MTMKIYKNPFVSRRSYFIPVAPQKTGKCEAKATKGYSIEERDGKWELNSAAYYNFSLEREMPVVGEIEKDILKQAVIQCVLDKVTED